MIEKSPPLYQLIINDIENQIRSGSFEYDTPICTEKSLCEKFQVSRITAKHAIITLENRGILYRKRGQGSFVVKPAVRGAPERTFALVIHFNITEGGIFKVIKAANQIFINLGHHLTIHICQPDIADNNKLFEGLLNKHIDGIIYYPLGSELPIDILNAFVQQKKPVVILDKISPYPQFSSIICDNYRGGYLLTEHLHSYGHSRICFLSWMNLEENSNIKERYRGFKDCHTASKYTTEPRLISWDRSGKDNAGYYMLQHMVNTLHQEGVTAIICINDEVAFYVHMCCQNLNIRVPEDMNITGFDNIEWAISGSAQITTVDQNFELIGKTLAETLLDTDYKPQNHIIPVQFIPRTSTGKVLT